MQSIICCLIFLCWGIVNTTAQEISGSDAFLINTFNKQEVLSGEKEIIKLPNPQGPHLIGTVAYHWVDRSRDEIVTEEDHDFRQVIVQIFYPAILTKDTAPAAYFPELEWVRAGLKTLKGDIFRKIEKDFSRYNRVLTNSFPNANMDNVQKKYPLLIFGTGGNMSRHNYTAMMEELASQGYITAVISHPYSSMDFFPSGGFQDDYPHWRLGEGATSEEREQLEQKLTNYLAKDAIFVLDQMMRLNQNDPTDRFKGRIDSDRVAIMGHSRGGSTVSRAASTDDRFKAVIIYDNIGSEPETTNGLSQPMMTMRAPWSINRIKRLHTYLSANESFAWEVVIDSATHFTFSDMPIIDPENYESKGNPDQLSDSIMKYSIDFLNHSLYGHELEILTKNIKDHDGVSTKKFNDNN
ncbi:MAG: prolyl oligopeptidase family serine peptidase [Candidatus Paceibacterota bacterium]